MGRLIFWYGISKHQIPLRKSLLCPLGYKSYRGAIFLILGLAITIISAASEEGYASWWDSSYSYYKQITVTASTDALESEYSVSLTFDHAALVTDGKSLDSGNDVRIVYDGDTGIELHRVLDDGSSWNNASTKIWFKTQAPISASGSDNNYYLYYGNSGAGTPPADKNNVYTIFDDFNRASVGSNYTEYGDTGVWSIDTNRLKCADTDSAAYSFLVYNQISCSGGFELTADIYYAAGAIFGGFDIWSDGSSSHHHLDFNPNRYSDRSTATALESPEVPTVSQGTWYEAKFQLVGNTLTWYHNETSAYTDPLTGSTAPTSGYMGFVGNYYTAYVLFDDFKVRKYVGTDSSISTGLGSETAYVYGTILRDAVIRDATKY